MSIFESTILQDAHEAVLVIDGAAAEHELLPVLQHRGAQEGVVVPPGETSRVTRVYDLITRVSHLIRRVTCPCPLAAPRPGARPACRGGCWPRYPPPAAADCGC